MNLSLIVSHNNNVKHIDAYNALITQLSTSLISVILSSQNTVRLSTHVRGQGTSGLPQMELRVSELGSTHGHPISEPAPLKTCLMWGAIYQAYLFSVTVTVNTFKKTWYKNICTPTPAVTSATKKHYSSPGSGHCAQPQTQVNHRAFCLPSRNGDGGNRST